MSSPNYIRSITEAIPDEIPTLSSLPDSSNTVSSNNVLFSFSWETWVIIILILALLGINVFSYLAKGTQETVSLIETIFYPILKFFGYTTLTVAEDTIKTGAAGTKAGVDIVSDTAISTIDTIKKTTDNNNNNNDQYPQSNKAKSSISAQDTSNTDEYENETTDSLSMALNNAKQSINADNIVSPDDSRSSIQSSGKSGWCYIGENKGIRSCAEIGVNDICMSGDIFPNHAICMNPNLRV